MINRATLVVGQQIFEMEDNSKVTERIVESVDQNGIAFKGEGYSHNFEYFYSRFYFYTKIEVIENLKKILLSDLENALDHRRGLTLSIRKIRNCLNVLDKL